MENERKTKQEVTEIINVAKVSTLSSAASSSGTTSSTTGGGSGNSSSVGGGGNSQLSTLYDFQWQERRK